jgi:hypothetical protein
MNAKTTLRGLGMFMLNSLLALLGPAFAEAPFEKVLRFHLGVGVVSTSWTFSILCAGLTAFFLCRAFRNSTAKWVWILPTLWFGLGVFAMGRSFGHTVFGDTIWTHFSGISCSKTPGLATCRDFFAFTVLAVRGISYSTGAFLSSQIYGHSAATASDTTVSGGDGSHEGEGG